MYTDAQKCSHIFDLQTFLRRIQQAEGSAAPLVPDGIWDAKTNYYNPEYDFSSPKYSLDMDNARTMEGKHKISDDPFLKE